MVTQQADRVTELAERLATNIKILRSINNWTQQDLADTVGCDRVTIARIETCVLAPKFTLVCLIADAFGTDVSVFTKKLA